MFKNAENQKNTISRLSNGLAKKLKINRDVWDNKLHLFDKFSSSKRSPRVILFNIYIDNITLYL